MRLFTFEGCVYNNQKNYEKGSCALWVQRGLLSTLVAKKRTITDFHVASDSGSTKQVCTRKRALQFIPILLLLPMRQSKAGLHEV